MASKIGEKIMRLIVGIVIGILLTIGGAYLHDTSSDPTDATQQRIVNWDVADKNFQEIAGSVREGWARLVAALDRLKG
jgi:hypothetical protein